MERVLDPGKEVALLIKGKCIFFEIAGDECAFTPAGVIFMIVEPSTTKRLPAASNAKPGKEVPVGREANVLLLPLGANFKMEPEPED